MYCLSAVLPSPFHLAGNTSRWHYVRHCTVAIGYICLSVYLHNLPCEAAGEV